MTAYLHQVHGTDFLVEKRRAALCDDMGLGKCKQSLDAVETIKAERVLIVSPNTVKQVWVNEIHKWLGKEDITVLEAKDGFDEREVKLKGDHRFTIVNWDLLGSRTSYDRDEFGKKIPVAVDPRHMLTLVKQKWDCIILDEAHRMRNRKSKAFEAVKTLVKIDPTVAVFVLTGTPIFNRPEELWPILHVINPKTYSGFHKWAQENCTMKMIPYSAWPQVVGVKDAKALKQSLTNIILRRTKDEVLDLPGKTYVPYEIDLYADHERLYEQMCKNAFVELEREGGVDVVEATSVLAQLTRLKQMCISPDLLQDKDTLKGAKADAALDLLDTSGDQKVVIFSQFAQAIKRLYGPVSKAYPTVVFTGEDPPAARSERIALFQDDPKIKVIMTTTQAGGVGVTLTSGSIVILLDLMWAPAMNAQAVDRVYRIGQSLPVTVYYVTARNTIEGYILKVLKDKEALFNSIIPEESIVRIARQALQEG